MRHSTLLHPAHGTIVASARWTAAETPLGAPMETSAQHEALLHTSPADLARQLTPRIDEALATKSVVLAALDPTYRAALRTTLGPAAAAVEFTDPAQLHSVPDFTVAARLARTGRQVSATGGQALVVDQYVEGLPSCDPLHWARLDIALNVALVGLPVTMLCAYPADFSGLERVRATHPTVPGGSGPNPAYRRPHEALVDFPPPPPPDLGPSTARLRFAANDLIRVRHLVGLFATAAGLDPDGVADAVLAVNEIATNSIEHGPGSGVLRLWQTQAGGLVAEVADTGGELNVPFPGITFPPPAGARGRGLWLAAELSDVMQVWSDNGGTVIRVSLRA